MMESVRFEATIQPWGNSLGLRITHPMSEMAHLKRGAEVWVEVSEEGLVVRPKEKVWRKVRFPYSEADLLMGMTPEKVHADELAVLTAKEIGDDGYAIHS